VQIALAASTNPVPLEEALWGPSRQLCGEWQSYVGI
jgi:hypothetical protein